MKILYYNWVDYLDPETRGGGVTVYQKNLITELSEKEDLDIYFLASGISFDPFKSKPRWERVKHGPRENRSRRFELINSGVLSPGHHSFWHGSQVDHAPTTEAFFDFIEKMGPFDIVHFNNLEGIPASALALKERFPDTRVVYSFHNYYPVCPQVNLWRQEKENCLDYGDGSKCANCLMWLPDADEVRNANAVAYSLKKVGVSPDSVIFRRGFGLSARAAGKWVRTSRRWSKESKNVLKYAQDAYDALDDDSPYRRIVSNRKRFSRRREMITDILNENCDRILCVSDRVAEVAAKFGVDPDLLQTSYIGTKHAKLFEETEPKPSILREDGTVTLAYMGYMRRDKGYYFLMEALKSLPKSLASKVRLLICAKTGDGEAMYLLEQLGGHLKEVFHADGYTHKQIDALLADVDVGVVPVQWEDNLPQVAIEMHARHIPLLTSDLGGARELGNTPEMVFEASRESSFVARLRDILDGKIDLDAYWANAMAPVSMAEHEEELLEIYKELLDPNAVPGSASARIQTTRDRAKAARVKAEAAQKGRRVAEERREKMLAQKSGSLRKPLPTSQTATPEALRKVTSRGRKLPRHVLNKLNTGPRALAGRPKSS